MFNPFSEPFAELRDGIDEPLTVNDWLNIINCVNMVARAFSETEPDKPLPTDLDGTVRRVYKASAKAAKESPEELINILVKGLDAMETNKETDLP